MKKIKLAIISTAILASIGGAFATNLHLDCRGFPQYYLAAGGYMPAGTLGVNYYCQATIGTCTYYLVGQSYVACQSGTYTKLP